MQVQTSVFINPQQNVLYCNDLHLHFSSKQVKRDASNTNVVIDKHIKLNFPFVTPSLQ